MREVRGALFCVIKIFFGHSVEGNITKHMETIAYFTNLNNALKEKEKHSNSFVFPFKCHFHKDRRVLKNILRVNFHSLTV